MKGDATVNTDYICIISENDRKTSFEKVEIEKPDEFIAKLKAMCSDPSVTILDMQKEMSDAVPPYVRGEIDYVSPYEYSDPFADKANYPEEITGLKYKQLIEAKEREIRKASAETESEKGKQSFFYPKSKSVAQKTVRQLIAEEEAKSSFFHPNKSLIAKLKQMPPDKVLVYDLPKRKDVNIDGMVRRGLEDYSTALKYEYYEKALRFINAFAYWKTLMAILERPEVRMYSHDSLGWKNFSYKITDNISVELNTDFGYGGIAYFLVSIFYKGVAILPYSEWIHYYYANMLDIRRFTCNYAPRHENWNNAFEYINMVANDGFGDEKLFVEKYIKREIRVMMAGLRELVYEPQKAIKVIRSRPVDASYRNYYTLRNMSTLDESRFVAYEDEMSMIFRAEKVVGALDFLESLSAISVFIPDIHDSIRDIKEFCIALIPEIRLMLKRLEKQLEGLSREEEHKQELLDKLNVEIAKYDPAVNDLYAKRGERERGLTLEEYRHKFCSANPHYASLVKDRDVAIERMKQLSNEVSMRSSFRDTLKRAVAKVIDAGLVEKAA